MAAGVGAGIGENMMKTYIVRRRRLSGMRLLFAGASLVPMAVCIPATAHEASEVRTPIECQAAAPVPLFRELPSFSLPALEPSVFSAHPVVQSKIELKGSVTVYEQLFSLPGPGQVIDHLVETAVARDTARDLLESKAKYHNKKWTLFVGKSKDMLQYMTSYQGFESSSEAADVILEEKLKLKSKPAVEFVRQKRPDAAHVQLTCAVMEVAMGLGFTDEQKRKQAIESGLAEMIPLVGKDEAEQGVQTLIAWSKQIKVPESSFERDTWDVLTVERKTAQILSGSLADDDVVKEIEARLHRYNHISNFSRGASKLINTSLSIIAFSPTMASPAAQTAQFVYIACTGGPEEKKLLKEVYLDRRFESRFERLHQEAILAADNYNNAILSRNAVLLSCAEALMAELTNADMVAKVTDQSEIAERGVQPKVFGERI